MQILHYLGLTKNESTIYLDILKNGSSKSGSIQKRTKITSSRIYEALPKLVEAGLLTYQICSRGKEYTAVNPDILKEIAQKKEKELLKTIPVLKAMQNVIKTDSTTGVFEGYTGFKNALLDFVEETPRNEEISIIGFSNQDYKSKKLQSLLRDVNKQSKNKKHTFRIILDNPNNEFYESRFKEKLASIRFMNNNFKSPASIDINKSQVTILIWGEKPLAIKIKDPIVAASFQIYFDFLWNIAQLGEM